MKVKCFLVNCAMVVINFPPYSLDLAPANFLSFKMGTAIRGMFQDNEVRKKNISAN
jgi:hypothetical protein